MRWALWIVSLCVAASISGLGVGAAWAAGSATTSTTTTTTETATTTTDTTATTSSTTTTSTTTTPSYAELPSSSLGAGCVGAGAAAVVHPSGRVITLGTPASTLGPSAYDTASGSVLSFDSLSVAGSGCTSSEVTLNSLSLFGGAVTVGSVQATDGQGTVEDIEIDGAPVDATAGETIAVGDWGRLTLGAVVGRVRAPLVFRLLQARDSLPAGTAIAVAFSAVAKQTTAHPHHVQSGPELGPTRSSQARNTNHARKHRRHARRPPPDFPRLPDPFLFGGALAPTVAHNPVVSIAMQYLGVPYRWGGASPKTGFDCSGLVKYVFAQLGVYLPHYAASQYYWPETVPVSPNHLRAGDLVFFVGSDGTREAPGHVGIYVGDGYLIDAPHTGAFVEIDRLDARWFANEYVGARRVVGLAPDDRLVTPTDGTAVSSLVSGGLAESRLAEPLLAVAAVPAAAHSSAPQAMRVWTGGGILLFLAVAGAFTYRRRRRPSREEPDGTA